jgi:hypothetical protein
MTQTTTTYSEALAYADDRGEIHEYAEGVHFRGFVARHKRDGLTYEFAFEVTKYASRNHAYAAAVKWLDAMSATGIKTEHE